VSINKQLKNFHSCFDVLFLLCQERVEGHCLISSVFSVAWYRDLDLLEEKPHIRYYSGILIDKLRKSTRNFIVLTFNLLAPELIFFLILPHPVYKM